MHTFIQTIHENLLWYNNFGKNFFEGFLRLIVYCKVSFNWNNLAESKVFTINGKFTLWNLSVFWKEHTVYLLINITWNTVQMDKIYNISTFSARDWFRLSVRKTSPKTPSPIFTHFLNILKDVKFFFEIQILSAWTY